MKPSDNELVEYSEAIKELSIREQKIKTARLLGKTYLDDYIKAINQAKSENKHIFMLFYLDGCSGCTIIKHLLSYNEQIIKTLQDKNYIVLKYNMSEAQCILTQKYNIYNFPSYFIIDGDEKTIKQGHGCIVEHGPENYLLNWLNK